MATYTVPAPHRIGESDHGAFEHSIFHGVRLALSKAGASVVSFLETLAASQKAAWDYERLANLNDAELTARGLARMDIPRHVFERHYGRS